MYPVNVLLDAGVEGKNRGPSVNSSAWGAMTPCYSVANPETAQKVTNIWAPILNIRNSPSTVGLMPMTTFQLNFDWQGRLKARDYVVSSQGGKPILTFSYGSN